LNTKIDSHVELAKNKLEKKKETKELTTENK
jgi:hypothetical protein